MKNDAIYLFTRLVETAVAVFSILAFIILFFFPDYTGQLFSWAVKPHMSSLYIGAAYLGGAWLQAKTVFGKRWHRVHVALLPMSVFTILMLTATLLHWDRFSLGTPVFKTWLIFYIIAPILIPAVWMTNKQTNSGAPEDSDVVVSPVARTVTRLFATVMLVFVTAGFLYPEFFIRIWPWALTPLTARVMASWLSVIGLGAWMMSTDPRWTSWRVFLESIFVGYGLVLAAAAMNSTDFTTSVINWFTIFITIMLSAIAVFYINMETHRRKNQRVAG